MLSISPNPGAGHFTLNCGLVDAAQARVEVTDMEGRMVQSTPVRLEGAFDLDLTARKAGAYLVRFYDGAAWHEERVIVAR